MTRDQAIAIRTRQLQGWPVSAYLLDEAIAVLRVPDLVEAAPEPEAAAPVDRRFKAKGTKAGRNKAREGGLPYQMLQSLLHGDIAREEFDEIWKGRADPSGTTLWRLAQRGWVEFKIGITSKGREALKP